jgi:hypothetical protein
MLARKGKHTLIANLPKIDQDALHIVTVYLQLPASKSEQLTKKLQSFSYKDLFLKANGRDTN